MNPEKPTSSRGTNAPGGARVLGSRDGEILGAPDHGDRIMVGGEHSGGGFSLAAPLHRHTLEDENSYVLEGRVGALLGEEKVFGEVGDLIFKPRGQRHTFWNAGDAPARILEIISPGGFEEAFRGIADLGDDFDPAAMAAIAARYGVEVDFERTMPIIERHGLAF